MIYTKPSTFHYRIAQVVSWFVSTFIFKRKILRNEIKGKKGAYVVIANHEAALDFVNLIGLTHRPMTFVISNSFYSTLPIKNFLNKMGVIPKQQFQTSIKDMKRIKAVVEAGQPLVIYPAGLMSEDGLSTPIPAATYKFLKWLDTDVYVAKVSGTYFAMPKWSKKLHPGKTNIDVYKLFSKEELENADISTVKELTNDALLFDAYRDQETLRYKYAKGTSVEGLENVLYMCPHCKSEFSIELKDSSTLRCSKCGFEEKSDEYGFLHKTAGAGEEIRYVSDWSRIIYDTYKKELEADSSASLFSETDIHIIANDKNKFCKAGHGTVSLSKNGFTVKGTLNGEPIDLSVPITIIPALPFSPGKHLEIQQGEKIYRCVLADGKLVMKFINMVKIFYELSSNVHI